MITSCGLVCAGCSVCCIEVLQGLSPGPLQTTLHLLVCTAMLLLAGTLGQALTPTFPIVGPVWLFLFRVAQGVAYGGKYSVGNVYLAERAPIRVLARDAEGPVMVSSPHNKLTNDTQGRPLPGF